MATVNLPDVNSKEFYRNARLLFWSLLLAVVALDLFNLIQIPEYFAGFTMLTYIVSFWVVSYSLLYVNRG